MIRRLEWIAPIFLIALMVQFFAPIAAGFAMAAASDPLRGAPICDHGSGLPQNPADHNHPAGDCCAFYPSMHGLAKEGVREIKWSGGRLPDDFVDDFDFRAQIATDVMPGPLYFPVTQSCAQGEHRWVEVPDAARPSASFEHPAPALLILAADGPQVVTTGPMRVANAFTRPTLGGATVAVGYMIIVNTGKTDDKLLSVTSDISSTSEIHESKMVGGVMEMDELPNGLAIPAGATVSFKPGSYHVMFVGLKHAITAGEIIHATLVFEKAGRVAVSFKAAQSAGATSPSDSMGGMKMP